MVYVEEFESPPPAQRFTTMLCPPFDQEVKQDAGKPDLRRLAKFIPVLNATARVLEFGARKYPKNGGEGWRLGPACRYESALLRHILAWINGEEIDVETGESHLAHAMCCLLFLSQIPR